jgi:hypothetical protein
MSSILEVFQFLDGLGKAEKLGKVKWAEVYGCFELYYEIRFQLKDIPWHETVWVTSSGENLETFLKQQLAPFAYPNTIPDVDAKKERREGGQLWAKITLYTYKEIADMLRYYRDDIRREI